MAVYMIGIDHASASVDIRSHFTFTKKNAGETMEAIVSDPMIYGCIILSTCNRLEIWISAHHNWQNDMIDRLCDIKGQPVETYRDYFTVRKEDEATTHLFLLASGLKSQIIGEDQILTQIKDALNLAREHFCTDNVLEVLFRMAITVGKKIKTQVALNHKDASVIDLAVRKLHTEGFRFEGKKAMVIGNGMMGKAAAERLLKAGMDVTVTIRQYTNGMVMVPGGCRRIQYGERYTYMPVCDVVVSATSSPNMTIRYDDLCQMTLEKPMVCMDLAVPRDIDPQIRTIDQVTLYDMDDFRSDHQKEDHPELLKANTLVKAQLDEFNNWYFGREQYPRISTMKAAAVKDVNLRIEKAYRMCDASEDEKDLLRQQMDRAVGKVFDKIIYGLRDTLDVHEFEAVLKGLEHIYEE